MVEKTVSQRTTKSFMKQDKYEANFDSFIRKTVGVMAPIMDDQFPGFHFSQVVTKLVFWVLLKCGDLHDGFARVKCWDCHHEYLPSFSCKPRHFYPSCHQKRVVEFGEWLSHISIDNKHNLNSLTPFSCRCNYWGIADSQRGIIAAAPLTPPLFTLYENRHFRSW